jgi:ADP-ribose pyrophosphatase YjhB (NUDIX family)
MKPFLELRDSDIFPNTKDIDPAGFRERQAVRAVVTDDLGRVALLWVKKYNHHKLPGGGVEKEDGGSLERTLTREVLEELGIEVEIIDTIGTIIEYEGQVNKLRISHCYLAEQTGQVAEPSLTQREIDDGQEIRWAEDIDEAIATIEVDEPSDYVGQFIRVRELAFLRAAAQLLRSESLS